MPRLLIKPHITVTYTHVGQIGFFFCSGYARSLRVCFSHFVMLFVVTNKKKRDWNFLGLHNSRKDILLKHQVCRY